MDDGFECNRNFWIEGGNRSWFVFDDCGERLGCGSTVKWLLARGHFVQQRAKRELIRPEIRGQAAGLLRRHIVYGAQNDSRLGDRCRLIRTRWPETRREFTQPEVQNLRQTILAD